MDVDKIRSKLTDCSLRVAKVNTCRHANGGAHLVERGLGLLISATEYLENLYTRVSKGAYLMKNRDILPAWLI